MKIDGDKLKRLLKVNGYTYGVFAELIGATQPAVSNWCNGRTPQSKYIKKIASVLGISPEDLFIGAKSKPEYLVLWGKMSEKQKDLLLELMRIFAEFNDIK